MTDDTAVAIVGMSARFPGARDLAEYWANLRDGVCSIVDFTEAELLADGADPAEVTRPDYVPSQGYLTEADRFEPELFGVNRTEAAALDPQHRLVLQAAWSALEDAGYNPRRAPARTGVYLGGSVTEHMIAAHADRRLAAELGQLQVRILTDREYLAPWVSYRLGLDGPSLTVQTACSTSLTAVHLAVQALILGECDAAVAGGVSIGSVRRSGYVYREGGVLSPDGRCRPFDEKAAGTVSGNGVGVVLLRRLSDALAGGDPIRAVIRGSAVTNDGAAKVGFTAPGVARQTAAIVEAWAAAGLEPSAAQYVEMHGTGTELGDPVEVAAASAAFARDNGTACGIGSVKANLGHLDAAAGIASLIKVVLMLGNRTVVPTVNVTAPSPDLALEHTPFQLATRVDPWYEPATGPRLAGVTAVGIGGTNVHAVVAEAPAPAGVAPADRWELLPLSARTEQQLRTSARNLATALRAPDAPALSDVAYTLRTGRATLAARAFVVAGTRGGAADLLAALADGRPVPPAFGPLAAIGESWVDGADVVWPEPAPGARRVHLPTYPFAGERLGSFVLGEAAPAARPAEESGELTEDAVCALLSASLGLESPDDLAKTYTNVGGDSLTAVHLTGRLRDELRVDLPIEVFLSAISLRELAVQITAVAHGNGDTLLGTLLDDLDAID
jgi:acyl transferase domain-containing protein